ncbi:MAG: glycosyltransferase family 2 protein [Candidatus Doudnabacteria bacterium]|nr:glycosyltransferase family 2 protein [Candidatus Doudnabacteria bacterium]
MDLSVIIVSFNTREKLESCLRAVLASPTKFSFEIFVVDNASRDDSPEMVARQFPNVQLIKNPENRGYARANNQAIRLSRGRYILLLNSDVNVESDTFDKMITYMDNNATVGISGCKVVKPDGTLDLACRRSFPSLANSLFRVTGLSFLFPRTRLAAYNLTFLPEDEIAEVDSVMGAFLMIRREVIDEIGLLDEEYFMYGEDLDWCYRAKAAGCKVMYVPITTVRHDKGSSARRQPRESLYEFHRAMQIFYRKHYAGQHNFFVNFLVYTGIWLRYILKVITR